ncbi:hypothetical protein COP2_015901 [Malus domestica]
MHVQSYWFVRLKFLINTMRRWWLHCTAPANILLQIDVEGAGMRVPTNKNTVQLPRVTIIDAKGPLYFSSCGGIGRPSLAPFVFAFYFL